jgi:class 3 adenylate cyclase/tetratricopeptide (TPR) repeat protein
MTCGNCGAELLPGKQFCHACGARVERKCPNCGARVEASFRFCPDCGTEVAPGATPTKDFPPRLSAAMPEDLMRKIRDSREAVEGERKQVTVLFCDLAGSTAVADQLDPEEYRELLDRYLALAIHEVYRFEGIVNQLAGDGFMALFGAPVAHEDAPQRAVWAALAIRDALRHFNEELQEQRGLSLPARIGIHTGPVVVGTVGNDLKMDYTAIGDTTNLAARLQALAQPGTVLASQATGRLVRGFFRMSAVGPLAVKGKSEPVKSFEILDASPEASPMAVAAARGLTPFVGRAEELAQLEACFERSRGDLPQVVNIVGDAGSGKSRLVYEFRRGLADEGAVVFEGRCAALQQVVPYHPFLGMLRNFFELTPEESHESAGRRVAEKLQIPKERLLEEYPLLCRLLAFRGPRGGDGSADELKRQTYRAVTSLVVAESRHVPAVMVIEDLQWIDEASRELLEMAISRLSRARVMIVLTHRPEFLPAWRTAAAQTQIHLRPLDDERVAEILRAASGGDLPHDLERSLLQRAEGSPFFAEEIVRSLLEDGYLHADGDGGCRLARPLDELAIPGTVQEVIAARLDRLGAAAKRVVQVAAVLGRQFSRAQLAALLSAEEVDVDRELTELVGRGILHRKSLFEDDEFRFGESLTQEVAYEGLLLRQRRQLHERIGTAFEAELGESSPQLVAHHFAHSDNRAKAIEFLLRAARDAEQLPSYRTALDTYRRAWEAAEEEMRSNGGAQAQHVGSLIEATLGYLRVTVLYGNSADPLAERAGERGRPLARERGDEEAFASFTTMLGLLLTGQRDRFEEGLALVEEGLVQARRIGGALQVVTVSRALALNYLLDGRFDAAMEKIDWVLSELERLGHRDQLTDTYVASHWMRESIRFHRDDLSGALRGCGESFELARRASNRTIQSTAATVLAQMHLIGGQSARAKEWADRALATAQEIDNSGALHRAAALALAARVDLGERGGLSRYVELVEEGLPLGGNVLFAIGPLVESFCALGDLGRAERFARTARQIAAGRLREMYALGALGEVDLRLGPSHWREAQQAFEDTVEIARTIGARSALAIADIGLGELAALRGRNQAARQHLTAALALCREIGMERYAVRAERALNEFVAAAASA